MKETAVSRSMISQRNTSRINCYINTHRSKGFIKFAAAFDVISVGIGYYCRIHSCAVFTGSFVLLL